MERAILHCDMNNFFASVECRLNPSIKDKPVAVCGDLKERHGIVLAKNYYAKDYGVKVGDAIWQAKQKCKDLIIASPPHYEEYHKFSKLAKEIYLRYTDLVEPYGIDECWLDVTRSQKLFGDAKLMADKIREIIKFELGLTISVGASFNKIFAKLGSDMKKPDATTLITKTNFKQVVWPLPASDLLGVGRRVSKTLNQYFIKTIGDIANTRIERLDYLLGKNGIMLHRFANELDDTEVASFDDYDEAKSVGHGTTTARDLENEDEVWKVILSLTQEVGFKLRQNKQKANGISITLRNNELVFVQFQKKLVTPTQSSLVLAKEAFALFLEKYLWDKPIRSITITAINLMNEETPIEQTIFMNLEKVEKIEKVEKMASSLQKKFGQDIIKNASLLEKDEYRGSYIDVDLPTPTGLPQKKKGD